MSDKQTAMSRQVGGNHYVKHKIQPWDIIDEYGLGFRLGCCIKYILRDKTDKREDLLKTIHTLQKEIEVMDREEKLQQK